tara:strand:+ start:3863 stop:4768 length:906 start_codon:yes stop_codon:yes gene_type:complete
MAMKISHTYLDVTKLDIVKRGNANHGKLQQLINQKKEDELKKNYHIIKLYAFGKITDYNNNNKLSINRALEGNNNKLSIDSELFKKNNFEVGSVFSIAEKFKGGDLFDYINDSYISISIAKKILLQVAYALRFIHKSEYIYYDLKPENIVLHKKFIYSVEDVDVRLIDFDFMIHKRDANKKYKYGTQPYMAPEVMGDYYSNREINTFDRDHTDKLDIFSFGITIIVLLTKTVKDAFSIKDKTLVFEDGSVFINFKYSNKLLNSEFNELFKLAKDCLKLEPSARLDINTVVEKLEGMKSENP